ncbi:TonB-dependent receptor [Novosphingobium sp. PS1R-30]|uniref:TonB-dependent receptor n=1 Tax=Novosphingobium anseongense TaxID=3133436 RepID=A0ABU8RV08_9SPHN
MSRYSPRTRAHILLSAAALLAASPACAEAPVQAYDIPSQPLSVALSAAAQRAGVSIIAPSELVEGRRAPAISGRYEPIDAIRRLLEGSGLVVERAGDNYVIKRAVRGDNGDGSYGTYADGEIVVTGTRIRGAPVASTLVRLNAEAARNTGQASVADILRAVPQNFGGGQNPGIGNNVPEANGSNIGGSSSINLRGLGSDATLTLLNGRRLPYSAAFQSVDISAIPLDAVDRIEIVADGASALYGSDAVAGVANIVLKRDFDGIRTSARLGASTDGGNFQQQYDLVGGKTWKDGGLLVAYEFARNTRILSRQRDYGAVVPGVTFFPLIKRHSVMVTGYQDLAPGVTLALDALYGRRSTQTEFPLNPAGDLAVSRAEANTSSRSFVLAPSLKAELGGGWRLLASAMYGKDRAVFGTDQVLGATFIDGGNACYCNTGYAGEIGGDGPLFALPGGDAQLAIGAGWRKNVLRRSAPLTPNRNVLGKQDSRYAYGEINLPFVSPDMGVGGIARLNLSAALRHERYPGIDNVTTPKIGLIYAPVEGFSLKGSWGKSFRAPTLLQLNSVTGGLVSPPANFGGTGFAPGATVLFLNGGNSQLKPERAESWSVTAALEPARGLRIEAGVFRTTYKDRIVTPILRSVQALSNPDFADLVLRAPSPAQVAAALASVDVLTNTVGGVNPANIAAIVNNAYANAAAQAIEGVDLLASYAGELAGGALSLSANASLLDSEQQRGPGQAVTNLAGTIFNPPNFRGRLTASWAKGPVNLAAAVNHIDGVRDTRFVPERGVRGMTTFDFAIRLQPGGGARGFDLLLAVENAFNAKPDPIRTTLFYDYPYDSTNYAATGRFVSLTLAKTW